MKPLILSIFSVLLLFCLLSTNLKSNDNTINVKWYPSYSAETVEDVEIGMLWLCSYLGAAVPKGTRQSAIEWKKEHLFSLNFAEVGFSVDRLASVKHIIRNIKKQPKYKQMGFIDVGELIMLMFNNSAHYYEVTGMPKTINEFVVKYDFKDEPMVFEKGESGIAYGARVVFFPKNTDTMLSTAFLAIEGKGSFRDGTFDTLEFEVFDFMDNGQPRFGIYNKNGKLIPSTDPKLSRAGKPAKCMWCHESTLSKNFLRNKDFQEKIETFNSIIDPLQEKLFHEQLYKETEVEFDCASDHRRMEFFYFAIEEPTAERLSMEWKVDIEEVKQMVESLYPHTSHHMPEMGEIYYRSEVDSLGTSAHLYKGYNMWDEDDEPINYFKEN